MGYVTSNKPQTCHFCRKVIAAGNQCWYNESKSYTECETCHKNLLNNSASSIAQPPSTTTVSANPAPKPQETKTTATIPPIKNDAPQAIPEPSKAIPQASPTRSARESLGTDPMTQAVVTVVDTLVEERIKTLEETLANQKPKQVEHVISIPALTVDKKLIKDPHPLMEEIISDMMQQMVPWFYGPAGSGKTTLAAKCADAMGLEFTAITFSAGSTKSEATGFRAMDGSYVQSQIYKAVKHGKCILLIDEYDLTNSNLATTLNTGLANRIWDFPHEQVKQHETCFFIVGTNTNGRGQDPMCPERESMGAATLDRFVQYKIDYDPNAELRWALSHASTDKHVLVTAWVAYVQRVRKAVERLKTQIVVTPRASIYGAKKINAGFYKSSSDFELLAHRTIFKGYDEGSIQMLLSEVGRS